MKLKSITKSNAKNKKFTATFIKDGKEKVVQFGDNRYKDFSIGATEEQRKSYRARHSSGANAPADTANALSFHILWNTRSRAKNIEIFKRKYNV
tara:strand:- start:156 stop:437 length:282 start_codon:yes stop_codon:yes gene_type:complete